MNSMIAVVANEHLSDLQQAAARWRQSTPSGAGEQSSPAVSIRRATADDHEALLRLAALDEEASIDCPALLALSAGEPIAALSLVDGRVLASPFAFTDQAVRELRHSARQLRPAKSRRRWSGLRRPRLAH
jgi:hypothetical protein